MRLPLAGRVAYLVIPHLPVAVERRERPRLARQPVVIAGAHQTTTEVVDCSREALQEGVRPGMPLARAERLCPEAVFLPPRLDLYRQASSDLFELLSAEMPVVEQAQPGGFYMGLAGLERQDGEALALCHRQSEAITRELRLVPAAGVAANKFTAEAASLSIGPHRALVLAAGTERGFLSHFPVDLLPVEGEMRRRLHLFGLRQMGQFARLPPAAVLAQFGWQGQRAHCLARGEDDRPLVPGRGEHSETAACQFDPPLDNLETLVVTAHRLAQELGDRLVPAFLRAGLVHLLITCTNGTSLAAQRILAEPTADAGRLGRLAEALLRPLPYADRVSELAVTLGDLGAPSLHQLSLWHAPQAVEADAHLARLAVRYGPGCFRRGILVDPDHRLAGRRYVMVQEN
jgi:DNA polymerase-4